MNSQNHLIRRAEFVQLEREFGHVVDKNLAMDKELRKLRLRCNVLEAMQATQPNGQRRTRIEKLKGLPLNIAVFVLFLVGIIPAGIGIGFGVGAALAFQTVNHAMRIVRKQNAE